MMMMVEEEWLGGAPFLLSPKEEQGSRYPAVYLAAAGRRIVSLGLSPLAISTSFWNPPGKISFKWKEINLEHVC